MRWLLAFAVVAGLAGCGSDTKVGEDVKVGAEGAKGGAIRAEATPVPTPAARGAATPAPTPPPRATPKATLPPAQNIAAEFAITAKGFEENYITVYPGSTIKATNKDTVARSIVADKGEFQSGDLAPGKEWIYTVNLSPGTYNFHDGTRPYVLGFLNVAQR